MSALWKNCEVENVICRKSHHVEEYGYKPHGVLVVADGDPGSSCSHPRPHGVGAVV
jgi:hypothetical protein